MSQLPSGKKDFGSPRAGEASSIAPGVFSINLDIEQLVNHPAMTSHTIDVRIEQQIRAVTLSTHERGPPLQKGNTSPLPRLRLLATSSMTSPFCHNLTSSPCTTHTSSYDRNLSTIGCILRMGKYDCPQLTIVILSPPSRLSSIILGRLVYPKLLVQSLKTHRKLQISPQDIHLRSVVSTRTTYLGTIQRRNGPRRSQASVL